MSNPRDEIVVCPNCGCAGDYLQALRCATNQPANLWLPRSSVTLPNYFKQGGRCYRFDSTSPSSPTPGTLLTGQTPVSSCADLSCECCTDLAFPATIGVSLSGINVCPCGPPANGQWFMSGVNAFHSVGGRFIGPSTVAWTKDLPFGTSLRYVWYNGANCTGGVLAETLTYARIDVSFDLCPPDAMKRGLLRVYGQGQGGFFPVPLTSIFECLIVADACKSRSFGFNNQNPGCFVTFGAGMTIATGGSGTVSW